MHDRSRVPARLRAITEAAAGLSYPDTDNQMEAGVFSFAKRNDEAEVWGALMDGLVVPASRSEDLALDVGCGLGAHAAALAQRFPNLLLLDADAGRAGAAAARLGWPVGERVFVARIDDGSLLHGDLEGAFGFVQMIQVLGHVPMRSLSPSLQAVHHLLAPGGHALFAVPFTGGDADLFFVTAMDAAAGGVRPNAVDARTYDALARAPQDGKLPVRHFCMTTLRSAATMAGFDVVEARPYHWFSHDTGDLFAVVRRKP